MCTKNFSRPHCSGVYRWALKMAIPSMMCSRPRINSRRHLNVPFVESQDWLDSKTSVSILKLLYISPQVTNILNYNIYM